MPSSSTPVGDSARSAAVPSSGRRIRTSTRWFRARWPTVSRSPSLLPFGHARIEQVRGEGVEPSQRAPKTRGLPISRSPRVHCGTRTRLVQVGALVPDRSAKCTCSGRRGSRTLKTSRSTVFETGALTDGQALPYPAAAAGVEPAITCLTGRRLTVRPHRSNCPVGTAGFEPAIFCTPCRRIAKLSYVPSQST